MSACSDACWQPNTTSSDITAFSLTEEENWRKPQLLYSFFLSQSPLRLTLKDYKNYLWHISAGTTGKFFFWGTVLNKFIRTHKYLRKNKSKTCLKLINILSVSCQIAETFFPKIWAGTLDWEVRTTGSNIKGGTQFHSESCYANSYREWWRQQRTSLASASLPLRTT